MKHNIISDVIEIQLFIHTTQPPIQWVPVALSLGVKQPGHEAHHSPTSAKVKKKRGSIHPIPHTFSWLSAELVKCRDNFTKNNSLTC
jgi:hypothetical protein